ncbi:hypothetical protein OPV22_007589 [Ensete ventricosum]|uniref:Phytosulfokine n=1 Tax=Ensete ventricosum TaxID=4639 RepID=A0AAV8RLQ7_ENSVE|nr:hypothetical protein OPV22_007589 [Ensete ventricosum]
MSHRVTVVIVALLLFLSLAHAGRPEPAALERADVQGVAGKESEKVAVEGCEGIGKEECLKRSTLAAHTDYIYTQGGETSEKTANSLLPAKFQAEAVEESTQTAERMEKSSLVLVSLLVLVLATADDVEAELAKGKGHGEDGGGAGIPWFGAEPGGFFGHGGGFHVPAEIGGGWGAGFGGPSGGYARGGVVRPSVVCSEKGPCYKKRVTCPDRCFTSFSRSGKGYGGGGGGGGCTIDCEKRCVASC